MIPHGANRLAELLERIPALLSAISAEKAGLRPAPDAWSPKEELGHLIDSAWNNHRRIIRAQLEDHPALPGYDGDGWVRIQRYGERDWRSLISLWQAGNEHLLAAARACPDDAWARTCSIGGADPVTLGFVLDDYVDHMIHHLNHIGIETGAPSS